MAEQVTAPGISMALDMKKNRIRIHKPTIHMLGDPTLIQLLFDPEAMVVAIICPENEVPGGQEIRVNPKNFKGENAVEFYSKMFLKKLRAVHGNLADNCTYRLTGTIIPELRAARFPMTEAEKRTKRCCFTGHRPGKLRQDEHTVKQALETAIDRAISRGFTTFITGMAQGTDIWAAEIVLERRSGNPSLKLVCTLPHPDFEKSWSTEWQYRYNAIRSAADLKRTICPSYTKTAYQKRNIWMVDHSALVIAVFNGKSGGTLNTIRYAQQNQVEILYAV